MRTDAAAFFESCLASFQRATMDAQSVDSFYHIAGSVLQLRFAGSALLPHITPALQHLEIEPAPPALTIGLWDGASTGGTLPRLPWQGEMMTRRGDIHGFGNGQIHAAFDRSADLLSVYDSRRALALFCTRDARQFPFYATAAPLHTLLFWMLRERDKWLIHAGAVGNESGAVLLVGKGGSGKSTTALACLNSTLRYLADDYCIVSTEDAPRVWSLYNTAKITPASLAALPFLQPLAAIDARRIGDKAVLFLQQYSAPKIAHDLPLKAILLPRVTGRATPRVCPAPVNAALSALALSTMVQFPNAGDETLTALGALTARLPCYYLELGRVSEIPRVIQDCLAR